MHLAQWHIIFFSWRKWHMRLSTTWIRVIGRPVLLSHYGHWIFLTTATSRMALWPIRPPNSKGSWAWSWLLIFTCSSLILWSLVVINGVQILCYIRRLMCVYLCVLIWTLQTLQSTGNFVPRPLCVLKKWCWFWWSRSVSFRTKGFGFEISRIQCRFFHVAYPSPSLQEVKTSCTLMWGIPGPHRCLNLSLSCRPLLPVIIIISFHRGCGLLPSLRWCSSSHKTTVMMLTCIRTLTLAFNTCLCLGTHFRKYL
jgi:hypothetical protein